MDASSNGDDVFFITAQPLVQQDQDTAFDLYDAAICGQSGAPECLPTVPTTPSACESLDKCRPAPSSPSTYGTPATTSAVGNGNLSPASQVLPSKVAVKPLTRAQKLALALKACKKKPKKQQAACKVQAEHKYGPVKKAKKSSRRASASRRRAGR